MICGRVQRWIKEHVIGVLAMSMIFWSCSTDLDDEIIEDPTAEETPDQIDPSLIVKVNTDVVEGELYNFWSTRPMVNQTRFSGSSFIESIQDVKFYVKDYNLVRVLGGRTDDRNMFYQGVDDSGNVIADFSSLIRDLRALKQAGFEPRIVLDNVPWKMNAVQEVNKYGNTNPPDDYGIWRKYINAFLHAIVNEFGNDDVKNWRFRIGTEPNYSPEHWNGTKEEYFKHYDITVDEVLKVIPEAKVGPGNLLTEGAATFTTEIIDHCATGTNYATGAKGTQMDFFSISYYEKIDQNTIKLPETVGPYRKALDSYAQFSDIPFDIQEFGILRDEFGRRGLSLSDGTEFGASWYARIADLAYDYKITEIYDWGQEIEGTNLPAGRGNVTKMFLKMEEGERLRTVEDLPGHSGIIAVAKEGKIYLLVYNHNTQRNSAVSRTVYPKLEGGQVAGTTSWKMNEWTVDKTHGVFMHELYKDCNVAGVGKISNGRIYGNRPSDYFQDGWKDVLNTNLSKYEEMAAIPQTVTDSLVSKGEDGSLMLEVALAPHSVKLIELSPQ